MDDTEFMRGFDGFSQLPRHRQRVVNWHGPVNQPLRKILAFHDLHHEGITGLGVFQTVDVRDVRVIERGQRARFAFEAGQALGISGECRRDDLDGHVAVELSLIHI